MNRYQFADLNEGHQEQFTMEVTKDMMKSFLEITRDTNPLHNDEEFAMKMGYPQKVVYGMLTASMLSTLAGVYLPGKYSLIHQVEIYLTRPVFVGDVLLTKGEVTEIHKSVEQIFIKVTITNQRNEKVLRGKMKVGFLHERE